MTRQRFYGEDTPFGGWVRNNRNLGSNIHEAAFLLNDADWIFHRYHINGDGLGTREVQCIMIVEVKTLSGIPNNSQTETLFFLHQLLNQRKKLFLLRHFPKKVSVWSHGTHILSMAGLRPDDSLSLQWGSFDFNGSIKWTTLEGTTQLEDILSFDIDPTSLNPLSLRRHHKTRKLILLDQSELGFKYLREITQRS